MKPIALPLCNARFHLPVRLAGTWRLSLMALMIAAVIGVLPAAEIHDAAESGDTKALESLLKQDAKLAMLKDKAGDQPLHHAAQKGQVEAARLLLDSGADVNARGFDDWTPLHWAAKSGSKALCKFLLEKGADPKALNGVHRTPLQMATGTAMFFLRDLEAPASPAAPEVAKAMPAKPVDAAPAPAKPSAADLRAAVLAAITTDSADALEAALAKGGDANLRNDDDLSLLQIAVNAGRGAQVAILLRHGAKPDLAVKSGEAPLIAATLAGSTEIVTALLKAGADPKVSNKNGLNALLAAALYGRAATGQLLINAGADLTATATGYSLGPLHLVAACGAGPRAAASGPAPGSTADYLALAKALLDHKAVIDAASGMGTPLMVAVRSGPAEMIALLLERGAGLEAVWAKAGYTPLLVAASTGRVPVIEQLIQRGAKLDARTPQGGSALHVAALSDQPDVIKALVKAGVAVDSRDSSNATPLIIAAATGHLEPVKTLLSLGANREAAANQGVTALKASRQHGQNEVLAYLLTLEAKE